MKPKELPSIDEELAQIFPIKPESSPQKDYTRTPFSGKKVFIGIKYKGITKHEH